MKKYTVYKTTNQINGKFYIGTHKTGDPNDSYLGSGTLLKKAIEKYGADNFKKEVLFVFDTPEQMFAKEAEIVTAEFLAENNTYNLKLGGEGGFDHLNQQGYDNPTHSPAHLARMRTAAKNKPDQSWRHAAKPAHGERMRTKQSAQMIESLKQKFPSGTFTGRTHSSVTKQRIGEANSTKQLGESNSQYGTMWITDGSSNKKMRKIDTIPNGWRKGRTR